MGTLHLGRSTRIDLPDGVLAHVHTVLIAKLRIHEPVLIGWIAPDGRRNEVMVNPTTSVVVRYDLDDRLRLDRAWLERLMRSANGIGGLRLTPDLIEGLCEIGRVPEGAEATAPTG